MAVKNLQFIVTIGVDVPDDWECPTSGTDAVEDQLGSAIYVNRPELATALEVPAIVDYRVEFETITD